MLQKKKKAFSATAKSRVAWPKTRIDAVVVLAVAVALFALVAVVHVEMFSTTEVPARHRPVVLLLLPPLGRPRRNLL